jgi:1-deoxy-D-xylulose-5-phosphate reductoisomerase
VLNAANEVAVEAFLARRIGFLAIAATVEATISAVADLVALAPNCIEEILAIDAETRGRAAAQLARFASAGAAG